MTNVIDLTKITPRPALGYTQGLPLGISIVDSNGAVALIVSTVAPSTAADVPTGSMYYTVTGSILNIYNGTIWKKLTVNT
jgi:hypothetical protein